MHSIVVPRLNANDESYMIQEWLQQSGDRVEPQTVIATIESSKATVELLAEQAGILHRVADVGGEFACGVVIGYIFATEAERQAFLTSGDDSSALRPATLTITKSARELMEASGISEADLLALGKTIVKRLDIETLLGPGLNQTTRTLTLSRRQRAIAETVSRSHATIPASFLVMKIYCDQALQALKRMSARNKIMVGLPELLVQITAGLVENFPFFFGTLVDEQHFAPADEPHIGVTFDVGKGLFVAVVKEPRRKSLREIGETLLGFRVKAIRDAFTPDDLSGGHISISLNTDRDVLFALPLIFPNQSCMISLGSIQSEVAMDAEQHLFNRTYVHLGLAYDHRVINGHTAVQFLKAIKTAIESQEEI